MQEDQPKEAAEKPEEAPASSDAQPDEMQVDSAATSSAVAQKAAKTIPHSRVVRAAELALKSASKAAGALADAEDNQIRSTLASLIKLTLTKLEMKMSQFEELEDILEDERKNLESARIALMSERLSLKKMLEQTREQLVAHGAAVPSQLGTTGQGPIANEVQNVDMGGPSGPVPDGSMLQLS